MFHPIPSPPPEEEIITTISKPKKKRNQPGNPDPDAEVVALSPKTLMTTNRFVCEICSKGFQRDQNLQLHRRGHNLPWKLRQKGSKEVVRKKVYVCPEPSCIHSHPSRALGDLTGIKKHFCRKHGEKLWRCDKCSKKYAVMSDWKAHAKTCGTREYRCDCGTLFSRKDSFLTHRAFCDALAEETARLSAAATAPQPLFSFPWDTLPNPNPNPSYQFPAKLLDNSSTSSSTLPLSTLLFPSLATVASRPQPELSATTLLQKASCMGCMGASTSTSTCMGMVGHLMPTWHPAGEDRLTRDFLGRAVPMAGGAAGEGHQLLRDVYGLDLITATCQQEGAGAGSAFHRQAWRDC